MIRRTAVVVLAVALLAPLAVGEEAEKEADDWVAKIEKAFDQKVSFKWEDAELGTALQLLQKQTGVTIILDPAVKKAVKETKISLTVKDMPAKNALGLVLRLSGMRYILKDRAVLVSTRSRLISELLTGTVADEPVEESRPMTAAEALVATSGARRLGDDVEDLTDPVAAIHSKPWRRPEVAYRDPRTGLMQFPAPPVWIASPYEGGLESRFSSKPWFLKPEYLAQFYYGSMADRSRSAQRELVGRLAALLRQHPDWTAKEILKQLEVLEAAGM